MHQLSLAAAVLGLAGTVPGQVHLNEIYISHSGSDTQEFVELIGAPGTSLDGIVVCVVEGDGAAAGTLDRAYNLMGLSIPASGYFVLGDAAVTPNDFPIGTQDSLENGTETFYVVSTANPAAITGLLGTNIVVSGTDTQLPLLGTVLDILGVVDTGFPATDAIFDGAEHLGPDGAGFFPAGVLRSGDFPNTWCPSQFLDFDPVINLNLTRTPGATNTVSDCLPELRFTEVMYNSAGDGGEFAEFTNFSTVSVDLSGLVFEDNSFNPALGFPLTGVLAPGQSACIVEDDDATFRAAWGLDASVALITDNTVNLGRNDAMNIYRSASGSLVTSVAFGDQNFPGSFRSEGVSLWAHADDLDSLDTLQWECSFEGGDDQGSVTSTHDDIGNPGTWTALDGATRGEWRNLGQVLAGDNNPDFAAGGSQQSGSVFGMRLWDGPENGTVFFVVGATNLSIPFKGGVLVPSPDGIFSAATDALGRVDLLGHWPIGAPSGVDVFTQVWFADAGGPQGFAAANAVQSTTP